MGKYYIGFYQETYLVVRFLDSVDGVRARIRRNRHLFRVSEIPKMTIRGYYHYKNVRRDYVMDKEWDTLIIIDACRFDMYKSYNKFDGILTKIKSLGSNTWEWFENNFNNKKYNNIIYLSANPQISNFLIKKRILKNPFFKLYDLWNEGWNDDLGTVHPDNVNSSFIKLRKEHKNKKFIIHYLQPHCPFIGEHKLLTDISKITRNRNLLQNNDWNYIDGINSPWKLLKRNIITTKIIKQAYMDNLKLVLKSVENVLPYCNGKVCISSDHGNSYGYLNTFYGHPGGYALSDLIDVPWFEVKE